MSRVINFGPGPSKLPDAVLAKARDELLEYGDTGMSIMEMSHRSSDYLNVIKTAENNLRTLMNIPDNYKVLFLQGGASSQFAAIPLNLFKNKKADYIVSGSFAKKAAAEAKKYGEVRVIGDSSKDNFSYIPKNCVTNPDSDYLHVCYNNTIYGTQYNEPPKTDLTLVADMSSCILGREVDVTKFGLIYAGAQKNMGIAGLTVVIIREDLIKEPMDICPTMFSYKIMAENDSMYNTPPCFAIYMAGLVFEDLIKRGGIKAVEEVNRKKAALLYDFLDNSKLFHGTANKEDRSIMNVTFVSGNDELDKKLIKEAKENNIVSIKGHRSVGGMRASLYNSMSYEETKYLVDFLKKFEAENYAG